MNGLHTLDFAVIAGYFVIIIAAGSYVARFSSERKGYFTAGAAIPWWLAAVSFWMATFSSLAFVTYSELAYKYGFTAIVLYCSGLPGMLVGALFLVGRWRRARQMSPIGFIGTRFNATLGQVFVWTRGALTGLIAGFVSGTGLLLLNIVLAGIYGDQFVGNPRINYWLNQGWTVSSISINFIVTIAGLWIGSVRSETTGEERRRTERFFTQLEKPYETEKKSSFQSPFPVIGLTVTIMGAGMAVVAGLVLHLFRNTGWFRLNLLAAAVLIVLGMVIMYFSRKRSAE